MVCREYRIRNVGSPQEWISRQNMTLEFLQTKWESGYKKEQDTKKKRKDECIYVYQNEIYKKKKKIKFISST